MSIYLTITPEERKALHKAFMQHRRDAAGRGIDFLLTETEWLTIWINSGHVKERGTKKGCYCMSRHGDSGPYSVDNVFIQLHSQNSRDATKKNIGSKRSLETRQLFSEQRKGVPNPHKAIKGVKRSAESVQKQRKTLAKKRLMREQEANAKI